MEANFDRIIKLHYKNVTVNAVLQEAVMNSIQANATEINIYLDYEDDLIGKDTSLKMIKVEDNGDGFTDKNKESFLVAYSIYKEKIGGKGIGRFSYVKLASIVEIESLSICKKYYKFIVNKDLFDNKDIKESQHNNNKKQGTTLTLSNFNLKHPNTKFDSCYDFIKNKFKLELFLNLNYKDKKQNIVINFFKNNQKLQSIEGKDIHCFKEGKYTSENVSFEIYAFKDDTLKGIELNYCVDGLIVNTISKSKNYAPQYSFAVKSDCFNEWANIERTNIEISKNLEQEDLEKKYPAKDFEAKLYDYCLSIIKEDDGDNFQKHVQDNKNYLMKNYGYIDISEYEIYLENLSLDSDGIIKKEREKNYKNEDELVKILIDDNSKNKDIDKLLQTVSDQNKNELAKYIFHRNIIVEKGCSLIDSNEKEDVLHNLFFPMKSKNKDKKDINIDIYNNSIWLLDDKFMSFSYVASDKTINAISKDISQEISNSRSEPDLFLLYNKEETDMKAKDAVLIEFKRGNIDYKDKSSAIDQIDEYKIKLDTLNLQINNFYCYIVCDFNSIDENLERIMKNRNFTKVYSNKGCIYYGYLQGSKTHITFISLRSIFFDAMERNKTFLNILKNGK